MCECVSSWASSLVSPEECPFENKSNFFRCRVSTPNTDPTTHLVSPPFQLFTSWQCIPINNMRNSKLRLAEDKVYKFTNVSSHVRVRFFTPHLIHHRCSTKQRKKKKEHNQHLMSDEELDVVALISNSRTGVMDWGVIIILTRRPWIGRLGGWVMMSGGVSGWARRRMNKWMTRKSRARDFTGVERKEIG